MFDLISSYHRYFIKITIIMYFLGAIRLGERHRDRICSDRPRNIPKRTVTRIVTDELNKCVMCKALHNVMTCSLKDVKMFEKSAALIDTIVGEDNNNIGHWQGKQPLWSADNVNMKTVTVDGKNMFDGMGIILSVMSPYQFNSINIPKRNIDISDILSRVTKPTDYPSAKEMQTASIKLKRVDPTWFLNIPKKSVVDYIRVSASVAASSTPQISGVMRMIYNNTDTTSRVLEKHKVFFCPIIDLKSDSMTCVYSTLRRDDYLFDIQMFA